MPSQDGAQVLQFCCTSDGPEGLMAVSFFCYLAASVITTSPPVARRVPNAWIALVVDLTAGSAILRGVQTPKVAGQRPAPAKGGTP